MPQLQKPAVFDGEPHATPLDRRNFLRVAGGAAAWFAMSACCAQSTGTPDTATDKGLWITWYDLPEAGRNDYLAWLHQKYIPGMLKRPGLLYAAHYASAPRGATRTMRRDGAEPNHDVAVPTGDRYILIFGATQTNVFGAPTPAEQHAALPAEDRRMLAMRVGERVNVMAEASRVTALAARDYQDGMALAPCIQLGSFNIAWQDEDEMLAWYAQSRMPAMGQLRGCIRTRKLASVAGWAKHAILYEFVSVEARNRDYLTLEDGKPEMKAWSDRMVPKLTHAPGSANLASRLWPPA